MPTAVNPQTGETLTLQNGQWVPSGQSVQAAPRQGPTVVQIPRRDDPYKARDQQLQEEKAARDKIESDQKLALDREKFEFDKQKAVVPSATQLEIENKEKGIQKRVGVVENIMGEVRRLYKQDIQGQPISRAFGLTEYIDILPENERFTAVGDNILPLIRPLVAQTAKEGDSNIEMQIFQSYIPSADDSDITIEQKLNNLELLINGMVEGRAPSQTQAQLSMGNPLTVDVKAEQETGTPGSIIRGDDGVILGFYNEQGKWTPLDAGPRFDANGDPIPADTLNNNLLNSFGAGVGDLVEGAGDVVGLVGNPLNAGINSVFGTNLSTDLGASLRDASGLPDNPSGLATAINQGGLAAMTGVGAGAALANAGRSAVTRGVGSVLAQQPGAQLASGMTAGGATEAARRGDLPVGGQIAAGLAGGVIGGGAVNALRGLGQRANAPLNNMAQIAERQGVDLMPADVGGPLVKRVTSASAQAPLSAQPVIAGARRTQDQIGAAAQRAAPAPAMEIDEAGMVMAKAGREFTKKTSRTASRLYDRAGDMAKGIKIKPVGALQTIDGEIARLGELPGTNKGLVSELQTLKNDISGGISVAGLRDARSRLAQGTFDGKLRSSADKAVYKKILAELSDDVDRGLRAAGRDGAANAFKTADKFWKERVEHIDEVLEPIIGKGKSGEDILQSFEQMARGQKGGVSRLSRVMTNLSDGEADQIRSTIIQRLGKATAGAQDETGQVFSANTFLTNWNKMSPKGKAALFGSGDLRRNLDEIAQLSAAVKESGKYANQSNTAGGVLGNTGAIVGTAALSPVAAIMGASAQYLTGRLMSSPAFTRWLAKAPPKMPKQYLDRLGPIAAREPIIANDVRSLQQFLGSNPGSVAAEEK